MREYSALCWRTGSRTGEVTSSSTEDHRDVLTQRGIQTGKALAETLLTDRGVACLPAGALGVPQAS